MKWWAQVGIFAGIGLFLGGNPSLSASFAAMEKPDFVVRTMRSAGCPRAGSPVITTTVPCETESPDGQYVAVVTVGEAGAHLLDVKDRSGKRMLSAPIRDINGLIWSPRHPILFFAVSPIYGKPGLYQWRPPSKRLRRIFGPRTRTSDYPDGADYFELVGISEDGSQLIFYYGPDVDKVDFEHFRTAANLYTVRSDGSGFRKAGNYE